jgi:hypothetical protein
VSATGRYKQVGKTVFVQADVTITTAGTAAGLIQVSLPFAAAAFNFTGTAKEYQATGKSGVAQVIASGSTMISADSGGITFIASGNKINFGLTYEVP